MGKVLRTALRWIYRAGVGVICLALVVVNARLYTAVPQTDSPQALVDEVLPQLRYLGQRLNEGAGQEMQALFPEGDLFSHALYGLACADLGLRLPSDSPVAADLHQRASQSLAHVDSPAGRAAFNPQLAPDHGIFYAGWTAYLQARVLALGKHIGKPQDASAFIRRCEAIATSFSRSPTPFLEAYPMQAWPCDSTVAIAALAQHDAQFPPRFTHITQNWTVQARSRLDPKTGLLPHMVHHQTGQLMQGARGSSQSIIQRFLPEIDGSFAADQYSRFRRQFVQGPLGLPGIREYPIGVEGTGDIDSGPLIFGITASATVVTIGAARVHGDQALAVPLWQLTEGLGGSVTLGGKKRYAAGLLPVGDAFVAWSKSAQPASNQPDHPAIISGWWRWSIHVISLLTLTTLWMASRLARRAVTLVGPLPSRSSGSLRE